VSQPLSSSDQLIGKRLGAYEIKRLVGHGATASVFEAVNAVDGNARRVAIKILHEHIASQAHVRARFRREGKVAAQLRHPNALEVFDVVEVEGLAYIVMELLDGQDLRKALAERGPLDTQAALALVLPVLSAVGHAHAVGAIHRDVKPANIVLARVSRDEVRPKLVDFGLSKLVDDDGQLSSTDLVAGTLEYMAPETTLGTRYCSPKSDQYSLAAVLYECVTGRPPIEADSFIQLVEAIRTGDVARPEKLRAGVPPAFGDVLLRALSRNPENRYPSVRAFGHALLPFADDDTVRTYGADFTSSSTPSPGPRQYPSSGAHGVVKASRSVTPNPESGRPELRPLPCPAGSSPFRIKGLPYRGLVHFVERLLPGGLDRLCSELEDPTLREFIRQPFLATSRYDVLPFVPLSATLARLASQPFDAFVRAATEAQARYDARTVYKRLYDGATKQDAAQRIARFEAQYNDFGDFDAWFDGPNVLVLQRSRFPAYLSPWYRVMHPAYTVEATSIIGMPAKATEQAATPAGRRKGLDLVTCRCEVHWP
jgi:serine/threonine protein kinase